MNFEKYIRAAGAIITSSHLVFTNGDHSDNYVNLRTLGHDGKFWDAVGKRMAELFADHKLDLIVGPETLGRTIGDHTGRHMDLNNVWADVIDHPSGKGKIAAWNRKLDFGRLIKPGMRIGTVDDLLTTGGSVHAVNSLLRAMDAITVVTGVVVRRDQSVGEEACGSEHLKILVDLKGLQSWSEEECKAHGPCSKNVPMRERPGHGHSWHKKNPNYLGGFI